MATKVTYSNKSQTGAYDATKWNAQDANELKVVTNELTDEAVLLEARVQAIEDNPTGISPVVPFSASIPFNKPTSAMSTEVSGPITFTPNTVGAVASYGTQLRIKGNGINTPVFAAPFIARPNSQAFSGVDNWVHEILFTFNGSEYTYFIAQLFEETLDTTPPSIVSRVATSSTNIRITFDEIVTATNIGWSFKKNGAALVPSAISGSGTLVLDFTVPAMLDSDTLLASYTVGSGDTMDAALNEINGFVDAAVTNSIPPVDTTAPTVVSAVATSATNIRLTFSETVTATNIGHSFKQNGAALVASAVSGSGTTILNFTVPTMLDTDVILRSYNSATGDTMDAALNELVSYTDSAVTNSIPPADTTPPVVVSMEAIDANTIEVTFNENVTIPVTFNGWLFNQGITALTINAVAGSGTTVLSFDIVETMASSDVLTGSYDSTGLTTLATKDTATVPNNLVSFTGDPVTNSIPGPAFVTWRDLVLMATANNGVERTGGAGTTFDASAMTVEDFPVGSSFEFEPMNVIGQMYLGFDNNPGVFAAVDSGLHLTTDATNINIEKWVNGSSGGFFGTTITAPGTSKFKFTRNTSDIEVFLQNPTTGPVWTSIGTLPSITGVNYMGITVDALNSGIVDAIKS